MFQEVQQIVSHLFASIWASIIRNVCSFDFFYVIAQIAPIIALIIYFY